MTETIKYTCSCCGEVIEAWPTLAYISPKNYDVLSEKDKQKIGMLNEDFCIIQHPDQTDRFIRCTLTQKVIDHCEDLEYGLWVSLSEKSYQDYADNFNNEHHLTNYFGWLCNDLPGYDFSNGNIPATVVTKTGNNRPEIIPHQDYDHPFVHDYYNGIKKAEAERRIKDMLNSIAERDKKIIAAKQWWKFW